MVEAKQQRPNKMVDIENNLSKMEGKVKEMKFVVMKMNDKKVDLDLPKGVFNSLKKIFS